MRGTHHEAAQELLSGPGISVVGDGVEEQKIDVLRHVRIEAGRLGHVPEGDPALAC